MAVGKSKSLNNAGVQAAADRMGTLDYGVDDMLRAISPAHVPLLSLAPLMIVIRDLMTRERSRVRFAFHIVFFHSKWDPNTYSSRNHI